MPGIFSDKSGSFADERTLSRTATIRKFKEGLRERGDGEVISERELAQYVTTFEHFKHEGDALDVSVRTWRRIVIAFVVCSVILGLTILGLVIGSMELMKEFTPTRTTSLDNVGRFQLALDSPMVNAHDRSSVVSTSTASRSIRLEDVIKLSGDANQLAEIRTLVVPRTGDPSTEADHEVMQLNIAWITSTENSLTLYSRSLDTFLYLAFETPYAVLVHQGSTSYIPYDTRSDADEDLELEDEEIMNRMLNPGSTGRNGDDVGLLQATLPSTSEQFPDGGYDRLTCNGIITLGGGSCRGLCALDDATCVLASF